MDNGTGDSYYHNLRTGDTTWKRPVVETTEPPFSGLLVYGSQRLDEPVDPWTDVGAGALRRRIDSSQASSAEEGTEWPSAGFSGGNDIGRHDRDAEAKADE